MSKRILIALLLAVQVPLLAWFGGFDFDSRGPAAFWCYVIALVVFIITLAYPETLK